MKVNRKRKDSIQPLSQFFTLQKFPAISQKHSPASQNLHIHGTPTFRPSATKLNLHIEMQNREEEEEEDDDARTSPSTAAAWGTSLRRPRQRRPFLIRRLFLRRDAIFLRDDSRSRRVESTRRRQLASPTHSLPSELSPRFSLRYLSLSRLLKAPY